jgi:hypothetical protein
MIKNAVESLESALWIIKELSANSSLDPVSYKRQSLQARADDVSHKLRVLAEHHRASRRKRMKAAPPTMVEPVVSSSLEHSS